MNTFSALIIAGLGLGGTASASDLSNLQGNWRTVRHGAEVKIFDCGDETPCGYLVSVSDKVRGGHTRDVNNKDKDLRARSLDGLPILWGYSHTVGGWEKGRLYNPETGQSFRSSLNQVASDRLIVRGCLGPFCREQVWTRMGTAETATKKDAKNDRPG